MTSSYTDEFHSENQSLGDILTRKEQELSREIKELSVLQSLRSGDFTHELHKIVNNLYAAKVEMARLSEKCLNSAWAEKQAWIKKRGERNEKSK